MLRVGKIEVPRWKETKDIFANIDDLGFSVDYFKKEHILAHAITNKTTLISSDGKMRFYKNQGLKFIWNRV